MPVGASESGITRARPFGLVTSVKATRCCDKSSLSVVIEDRRTGAAVDVEY
jgi:hypothetical protein